MLRQSVTLAENRDLVRRLRASEAELRHRVGHDALTGLPNRALLHERLARAAAAGPAGVLLVDLDGFKRVNDTLGHAAGDALLVEVARRLRAAVPEPGTVARLGGDEFAAVLPVPDASAEAAAREVAARVVAALRAPYEPGGVRVDHVGASVGTACSARAGTADAEELLR
ncbi:diguanylate cyclase, partial [Kineococcus sp. T90]|nr:diguanylate cyclase [Kineococcus indalonis]